MAPPIILDGKILNEGLNNLLASLASYLSAELSVPTVPSSQIQKAG